MATAIADIKEIPFLAHQKAPPGFTREQWHFFEPEGYLLIEDAIPAAEVRRYIEAADRIAADHFRQNPGKPFTPWSGIAHLDPVFTELIDHHRHIGFAYDIYGELL